MQQGIKKLQWFEYLKVIFSTFLFAVYAALCDMTVLWHHLVILFINRQFVTFQESAENLFKNTSTLIMTFLLKLQSSSYFIYSSRLLLALKAAY